jgi:hypothetical protein
MPSQWPKDKSTYLKDNDGLNPLIATLEVGL